ncbi:DUF4240 domain-containing protein [Actinomadura sp. HBU206391]|uniref:DUF4240 domain-containing protein n=1 Tax=Actinomadura sp. HBU206391 TaxID=2731692 RepID=UPI00165001E6|nr:DUF4240 domain-containing protein [Actinomadura sp. HBU206391]MBC6457893.1 DUF4240 domain-containing protein [Actinomadura sp. HBU206391]
MDRQQFWDLIEDARTKASQGSDARTVADHATASLAALPREQIVGAAQPLWDLLADSYRDELWAAAYLINGGASDDGFEYFRGWLIAQGRETFERAVADPDSLADLPAVRAAAAEQEDLEDEDILRIAWDAHLKATGEELPPGSFTIRYPRITADWDFDDPAEVRSRLPRLARLHMD